MAPRRRPSSRSRPIRPNDDRTRAALEALLRSLGCDVDAPGFKAVPARAADLWKHKLLHGQGKPLADVLGGGMRSRCDTHVSLVGVNVHLVCPHHLTVAFGEARVAYAPNGRLVGLGRLTRLLETATARLVLQEDATQDIVDTIVTRLGARAAVASIAATHPCNNLTHPRAHAARIVTWAAAGETPLARVLRNMLQTAASTTPP